MATTAATRTGTKRSVSTSRRGGETSRARDARAHQHHERERGAHRAGARPVRLRAADVEDAVQDAGGEEAPEIDRGGAVRGAGEHVEEAHHEEGQDVLQV